MQDTEEHLSHQRWLINNGFINDLHKDNLSLFGQLIHVDIKHHELAIDVEKKHIKYVLYTTQKLLNTLETYKKLKEKAEENGLWALWRFNRFLKKEGNLEFNTMVNACVKNYCGSDWKATVDLVHHEKYTEGFKAAGSDPAPDK